VESPLLLVDSASLYFRAYFGISPSSVTAPDGTPVNAVRGFLDMVATLVRTRRPGRLVCALDADWRPAWRVALLPSYKTHRLTPAGTEASPDDLGPQVEIILDVLDALGVTAVGAAGFEADDVIGTLATREPGPIEIATGDRDLLQLIDDERRVRVLYCGRGVAKLEVMDDAAVRARYGVPAAGYADLAVLRGDPSDGLPGVAGVGEKTAARLVTAHGGIPGILAAAQDPAAGFAPGLRTRLIEAGDYLAKAIEVVDVKGRAPVPPVSGALPCAPADPHRVVALAERWNITGALRRIVDALALQ
jgi:5'-3' exonuclease